MLARRMRVKETIPWFDGARLDDIVDYLTYVFAPVVLLWTTDRLPSGTAGWIIAALPLLTSSFQFCRVDAKTEDHFFLGFPSYWNIVAFYVIVMNLSSTTAAVLFVVCSILVFVPVRYVYPSRTEAFQTPTLALTAVWLITYAVLVAELPHPNPVVLAVSLGYVGYYLVLSGYSPPSAPAGGGRCQPRASSAADRSATRSSVSSMPQENRTNPGATASPPHWARRSTQLCTPPKLVAAVHSRLPARNAATAASSASSAETTPLGRSIWRAARADEGSPARQGHRTPVTAGDAASTSVTAAALAACRASRRSSVLIDRCPSHASNGPGVLPLWLRQPCSRANSSSSAVLTWPSSRSLCPVSAFVSLATVRCAPSSSGRWPSGVAVVLSTATRAPAARAARATAAMSQTSSCGLLGVSSSTSRAPSRPPAAATPSMSRVAT